MSKSKATVYHVGDRVKIIKPLWVERVGYNLHYEMLMDEARDDPKTLEAYERLRGNPLGLFSSRDKLKIPYHFVIVAAKIMVEQREFGGRERKIHYYENHKGYAGSIQTVRSKRVVNTGDYVEPGYPSSMNPEDEGTQGGLENRKTHVLLLTDAGEIEACNVERVQKAGVP